LLQKLVNIRFSRFMKLPISSYLAIAINCLLAFISGVAVAEHPVDVQRFNADGDYFKALEAYEKIPDRRLSKESDLAAARSAWALGLTKQATSLFDAALRDPNLESEERARITLSRGVIEYQEERYLEAALFAEKAASYLPERAPLRGRALLLWGESLIRAKAYTTAEEKLWRAIAEVAPSDRPDAALSLGKVQLKLGKLSEAERSLKAIPTDHPHAAEAIRLLASIALQSDQGARARFWLEKGRAEYGEHFLDSWSDYGLVELAIKDGDMVRARELVAAAAKRLPPSDNWLIIMQASLEEAEWQKLKDESK
jgi:tetratricopeptide (TPR) repeat protein